MIARGLDAAHETGAAVPIVPLVDTIKEVGDDERVVRTLDRRRLWAAQTPQVFRYELLMRAHRKIAEDVTDDAAMIEMLGVPVKTYEGRRRNIKITTPEDLWLAEAYLH
jgi:2-C-methyl-D-erythritol 4-phosphate cytidylyltransferase